MSLLSWVGSLGHALILHDDEIFLPNGGARYDLDIKYPASCGSNRMPETPLSKPVRHAHIVASADAAGAASLVSSSYATIISSDIGHFGRATTQTAEAEACVGNAGESSATVGPATASTV
jgi:hypothetical protein